MKNIQNERSSELEASKVKRRGMQSPANRGIAFPPPSVTVCAIAHEQAPALCWIGAGYFPCARLSLTASLWRPSGCRM